MNQIVALLILLILAAVATMVGRRRARRADQRTVAVRSVDDLPAPRTYDDGVERIDLGTNTTYVFECSFALPPLVVPPRQSEGVAPRPSADA